MWQSLEVLNVFNTLTLKQIFWITKTFFKKLESCFLVESTKIENASFPYKTAISETSVKNRRGNIKWTYHKEQSLLLFFWKFCFSLRTSCKELIWCTIYPNAHIHTFHKRWSFIQWQFSLWVSKFCSSIWPLSKCKEKLLVLGNKLWLMIPSTELLKLW